MLPVTKAKSTKRYAHPVHAAQHCMHSSQLSTSNLTKSLRTGQIDSPTVPNSDDKIDSAGFHRSQSPLGGVSHLRLIVNYALTVAYAQTDDIYIYMEIMVLYSLIYLTKTTTKSF
jgi:hypothetical protein